MEKWRNGVPNESRVDSFLFRYGRPGDTRGPAEEAEGRTLAGLKKGDTLKISDFMGRGFSSLFVGWIGLQSALQVKVDGMKCRVIYGEILG